ncbi:MAG: hypothetical protein ACYC37_06270 [Desulfobacteria bacterium]
MYREVISRLKKTSKIALVALLAALLFAATAGSAAAALPAPNWMPNSPIMAGAQIIILWLPVPGATKYNIYLNDKKVAEAAGVQHIIPAPEEAGEYKLVIVGVDASGAEGAKSTPGVFQIIKIEPPKSLIGRVAAGKVALRWDKTPGAVIYNLYRAEKKDGPYKLAGSLQADSYTDGDVSSGKTYFYTVSAKDLSGKESKRSAPFLISLAAKSKVVAELKVTFKALPTEETARVGFIDGKRIQGLSELKVEKSTGEIWLVIENKLFRMNGQGEVVGQIGPVEGVDKFISIDFGPDGNLYLSDLRGNVYSLDRKGVVRWKVPAPKPPLDHLEIWQGMPVQIKNNYGPTGGDVLCLDDEVWVTDQMFALIYVFDYNGKFQRYIYKYTNHEGKVERFSAVGEAKRLKDGRILLAFPLAHYASVVDKDFNEVFAIGKLGSGFVGRFIGIAGSAETPDGNLVFTDPGVNSIQIFDGKTGAYLHHIGGTVAKEDPGQPGRAYLDFGAVAFAQFLDAQNLVLFTGSEKSVLFLKLKKG